MPGRRSAGPQEPATLLVDSVEGFTCLFLCVVLCCAVSYCFRKANCAACLAAVTTCAADGPAVSTRLKNERKRGVYGLEAARRRRCWEGRRQVLRFTLRGALFEEADAAVPAWHGTESEGIQLSTGRRAASSPTRSRHARSVISSDEHFRQRDRRLQGWNSTRSSL